jgi:hypothetical protein
MSNTFRTFALTAVSAGILGAAALGLAGVANAGTYHQPSPNIVATPTVTAHPAPEAVPGYHRHHGVWHLGVLEPGYTR